MEVLNRKNLLPKCLIIHVLFIQLSVLADIKQKTRGNLVNISDEKLMEKSETFINYHGLKDKGDLRLQSGPLYYPPKYYPPSERTLNLKVLDLMRQAVYDTQDKMTELDPVLERYRNDPATRMAFIFNRLRQLLIDLRRIYTLASRTHRQRRVWEQLLWYKHVCRKFVDILYVVEYLIDSHVDYARTSRA